MLLSQQRRKRDRSPSLELPKCRETRHIQLRGTATLAVPLAAFGLFVRYRCSNDGEPLKIAARLLTAWRQREISKHANGYYSDRRNDRE